MGADRAAHADPTVQLQVPSRQVLEGWLLVSKEGCSCLALAGRFGPWHTIYMRVRRWIDNGALDRVFAELQRVELEVQLDQRETDRPLNSAGSWSRRQRRIAASLRCSAASAIETAT